MREELESLKSAEEESSSTSGKDEESRGGGDDGDAKKKEGRNGNDEEMSKMNNSSLNTSHDARIAHHQHEDSSDSCDGDSDAESFMDVELKPMGEGSLSSDFTKAEEPKVKQEEEKEEEEEDPEQGKRGETMKRRERIKKKLAWIGEWLWRLFPPPTISVILGILVGVCPFLKRELITSPRYVVAGFINTINLLGQAAPSFTTIILGIGLANMPNLKQIDKWGAFMSVVGKQVIVAAVGVPIVAGLYYGGILPEDPVVAFTMLVEGSTPAAVNLIVVCQLTNMPVEYASAVLFTQYLFAPVLVGLSTVAYVYLAAAVFV